MAGSWNELQESAQAVGAWRCLCPCTLSCPAEVSQGQVPGRELGPDILWDLGTAGAKGCKTPIPALLLASAKKTEPSQGQQCPALCWGSRQEQVS